VFADVKEDFQVRSATSAVGFETDDAPPPPGFYVGVDDKLFVFYNANGSNSGLIVNVRMLRPDGIIVPLKFVTPPANQPTPAGFTFQLMEGWMLSVQAIVGGTLVPTSMAFTTIGVGRPPFTGSDMYGVLCAGYVSAFMPVSYPEMQPIRAVDGTYWYGVLATVAPGAGADFVMTVPANFRFRAVSLSGLFTTSAVAGNRTVTLVIDDGANILAQIPSGVTQIISLATQYTFADSVPNQPILNNVTCAPLPSNLILTAGMRIRSLTGGILAGDQWGTVRLFGGSVYEQF
jgi:hypothetical protein